MPIYEYQCSACDHKLEVMQRISEPPRTDCPVCGAAELQKLISRVAFHLKGTGWYETDFKNKEKGKPAGKEEAKSEDETKSKEEAKSKDETKSKDGAKTADSGATTGENKPATTDAPTPKSPAKKELTD